MTTTRPWWLLPSGRIHASWWLAVGAVMLGIDYITSLTVNFPVVYVVPVILAAWYSGKWPAVGLAVAVPVFRLVLLALTDRPSADMVPVAVATALRGGFIIILAFWFARFAEFERALQSRVDVLEGLLPICAFCKNIRNDAGEWERLEGYISRRSNAAFSHGICPSCTETYYPGLL